MSSIFSYSNSSETNEQQEKSDKPPPNFRKNSCPRNAYRCNKCYPNQPKLTRKEIEQIKILNEKRIKPRALKFCLKHSKSCKNFCEKANYYIEQEIPKYYLKVKSKPQQKSKK